ncbi:Lrp/AsnC family transcriptional regulator [Thermosphaera sp.]
MRKKKELDVIDLAILKYLQENPKLRVRELAKVLKIPKSTIYHRLRQLEMSRIIKKYGVILDSDKLGYEYFIVMHVRAKYGPKYHEEVGRFLAKNPYVQSVYYVLGDVDFIVIAKFPSKPKYMEFLEELINSPMIERSSTMVVAKVVKEETYLHIELPEQPTTT